LKEKLPKRILMTADPIGGVWTYALELIRGLAAYDVEVGLATMGAPLTRGQREESSNLGNLQIWESDFKLEWMPDPWDDVRLAGEWLLEIEQRFQPDLVHLNGFVHAALPWSAPTLVVGHSCVLSWWRAVRGSPLPAAWENYRALVTRGLHAADFVVAPSESMLTELRTHYGPLLNCQTIYNGREIGLVDAHRKEQFVFGAGRLWDEAKNLNALASAATQVPWPVYLAGEGEIEASSNVHMLGQLPPAELLGWLSRAAIYASPANYEPFGLSILEAALAGCALVLGDIPSLREIWQDAAIYVEPSDTTMLRDCLLELMSDQERCREFGARARKRAAQFTRERMVDSYWEEYCRLVRDSIEATDEEKLCAL